MLALVLASLVKTRVKESQRLSMFQLLIHLNLSACIEECKSISRGFNLHQVNCVCEPEASPILVCRLQNLFLNLSKTFIFLGRQTLLKKKKEKQRERNMTRFGKSITCKPLVHLGGWVSFFLRVFNEVEQ